MNLLDRDTYLAMSRIGSYAATCWSIVSFSAVGSSLVLLAMEKRAKPFAPGPIRFKQFPYFWRLDREHFPQSLLRYLFISLWLIVLCFAVAGVRFSYQQAVCAPCH
jgi:hypothetical protein